MHLYGQDILITVADITEEIEQRKDRGRGTS